MSDSFGLALMFGLLAVAVVLLVAASIAPHRRHRHHDTPHAPGAPFAGPPSNVHVVSRRDIASRARRFYDQDAGA